MSFIRVKIIKGHRYYYEVESKRVDGKVKQKILKSFGTTPPDNFNTTQKKSARKEVSTTVSKCKELQQIVASEPISTTFINTTNINYPANIYKVIKSRAEKMNLSVNEYILNRCGILPDGTKKSHHHPVGEIGRKY
jgi:predicted HicB family RNase H-like nuclease